jgi:hypothetical protein
MPLEAERYALTAPLEATSVQLNGRELRLGGNDELPELRGQPIPAGPVELAPASIMFLAIPSAGNANCR